MSGDYTWSNEERRRLASCATICWIHFCSCLWDSESSRNNISASITEPEVNGFRILEKLKGCNLAAISTKHGPTRPVRTNRGWLSTILKQHQVAQDVSECRACFKNRLNRFPSYKSGSVRYVALFLPCNVAKVSNPVANENYLFKSREILVSQGKVSSFSIFPIWWPTFLVEKRYHQGRPTLFAILLTTSRRLLLVKTALVCYSGQSELA